MLGRGLLHNLMHKDLQMLRCGDATAHELLRKRAKLLNRELVQGGSYSACDLDIRQRPTSRARMPLIPEVPLLLHPRGLGHLQRLHRLQVFRSYALIALRRAPRHVSRPRSSEIPLGPVSLLIVVSCPGACRMTRSITTHHLTLWNSDAMSDCWGGDFRSHPPSQKLLHVHRRNALVSRLRPTVQAAQQRLLLTWCFHGWSEADRDGWLAGARGSGRCRVGRRCRGCTATASIALC
mmetsp:Transcript_89602/g.158508  ORF Transcript_89602/g.158508 Transcript_89602/m.158508 type:complete len:236 (-) Transcript_89602:148-855(-)